MNPEQLWETTLDPNVRTLLQVHIKDIHDHAEDARDLWRGARRCARVRRAARRRVGLACIVGLTLGLAAVSRASAQQACLGEVEPNDQIEQAGTFASAGCFKGTIEPGVQDRIIWSIPAAEGAHGWTLSIDGGYRHSTVTLQVINPASAAEPAAAGAEILRVDAPNGAYRGNSPEVLLSPGDYLLSVLSEGASPYRLQLAATVAAASEVEPNDSEATASSLLAETVVAGTLKGEPDYFRFTVPPQGARRHWSLELNGPSGQWISLELQRPGGESILATGGAATDRPMQVSDLGLATGDYLLKLSASSDGEVPYTIKLLPGGPRVPSREDEPNDTLATAGRVALGQSLLGQLNRGGDADFYALDVAENLKNKLVSISLKSGPSRSLCLVDATGIELQCRNGTQVDLARLALPAGHYGIEVSGSSNPDQPYTLVARLAGPRRPDSEAEPNEKPQYANPLQPGQLMQAQMTDDDIDMFALRVDGAAQLWTVKAEGSAVDSVVVSNFEQTEIGSGESIEGTAGATAGGVFLLPGEYWIKVMGKGGDYAISAVPTGPPDPSSEREPNDDDAQAQRLDFGVARSGQLSDSTDRDVYRFSLFAPDHIKLEVDPAAGDEIGVELEWGYPAPKRPQGSTSAEPYVYDALLDPGDYVVRLRSQRRSSSPYRIELSRADPFVLPDDLEPNDSPAQAHPLPASLNVVGGAASSVDPDWFALPALQAPTKLRVEVTGNVEPSLVDGSEPLAGDWQPDRHLFEADLPAGHPLRLGIKGDGAYVLKVSFDDGPKPATLAPFPLDMTLSLSQPVVAAFWIRGQRVHGTVELANKGDKPIDLDLDLVSSHFAYQPQLTERHITLEASGQRSVPFDVVVAPDAWANQRVDFAARASAVDGGSATAVMALVADPMAPPVAQEIAFPLPKALLGGFDVASKSLGGIMSLPDGDGSSENPAVLQDGLVGDANIGAFVITGDKLPYVLTAKFGTDHPLMIGGITIHPQAEGRLYPAEQLRDFDLLLSEDGINFKPALSGSLSMLPVEQAFVLDIPVAARAAQLRLKSNHADNIGNVGLGEWKVIAVPGEPQGLSADIAEWARGGHVVWSNAVIGSSPEEERSMLGAMHSNVVTLPADRLPQWVLGFNEDRAAQITRLEWVTGEVTADHVDFGALQVATSTDGPFGPWHELGTWTLTPDADGTARLKLPQPVWARFVRFTASAPAAVDKAWVYPKALRIFEEPTSGGYLSILGEWGQYNRSAIFEATTPIPPLAPPVAASSHGTRAEAEPLPLGKTTSGEVRLNEVDDWYAVDVPEGMNRLALTASGEPTVDVTIEIEAEDGAKVPLVLLPSSADQLNFEAKVEGGRRYLARVLEPQRSVAIAYDTSPSLAAFAPIIRHAMADFAEGTVPGREYVNFMNFASPFILKDWTDQPWVLEGAVLARPGPDQLDSSELERTMNLIMQAMASRLGVRAAIVVTDAQTPGFTDQPQMWAQLGQVRPRIFTAHIGAGNDPYREKQMMQDLALVNGGYYASARTQAEMDVVSERAAAWLRRPTRYQLVAAAHSEIPPEPGSLQVMMAARPVDSGRREAAAPSTQPASGAVELIFDASGSMLKRINGERRIAVARKVLSDLVDKTLSPGQFLAMRVFGDDHPDSCETRLAAPLGPLDAKTLIKQIKKVTPVNLARTPIAASLRAVAADLSGAEGLRTVILVTDGEETCGGDPQTEIARLRAQGFDVRVNIVGFAVDDASLKQTFQQWATTGGGRYFDAGSAEELGTAVRAAVALPFSVRDSSGAIVGHGTIGGPALTLPPGGYRIEIGTTEPSVIDNVVVAPGLPTTANYSGQ